MFDLRYHVASLAAVFLALVIGILVGVGISDQGLVDSAKLQRWLTLFTGTRRKDIFRIKGILCVDDDEVGLKVRKLTLESRGYSVWTAANADAALKLSSDDFDLYILDVRLPDGTGVELCQKLRALNSRVPILYYSAYGDEADHAPGL